MMEIIYSMGAGAFAIVTILGISSVFLGVIQARSDGKAARSLWYVLVVLTLVAGFIFYKLGMDYVGLAVSSYSGDNKEQIIAEGSSEARVSIIYAFCLSCVGIVAGILAKKIAKRG